MQRIQKDHVEITESHDYTLSMLKKRLVVKVGSSGVSIADGGVDLNQINKLIKDIHDLRSEYDIILVSSGAINTGKKYLHSSIKDSLLFKQAASAIGQPLLMNAYEQTTKNFKFSVAQILVTHEDFKAKDRFLNIRNTMQFLLKEGILPIVNENDTVSTKEITVGDNDQLAVMIAKLIGADHLIILSETNGLYDQDPKNPQAKHIKSVSYGQDLSFIRFGEKTQSGRGGMSSKLAAIEQLTPLGISVYLASHRNERPLIQALKNAEGTQFHALEKEKIKSKTAWIATVTKPGCYIVIDEGAYTALQQNKSLLPVGIKKIVGHFKRGDVVLIKFGNKNIAMGICEFDAKDLEKIKGKKSNELQGLVSTVHHEVAIHKDNLYLIKGQS